MEELHLCRNKCSQISSKFQIDPKIWKNLKYLNLEDNNISDWDEIQGFRNCPLFYNLGMAKNKIRSINFKPGFRELYCLSLDDNLIDNWASIDQLNEYRFIKRLRFANNPLLAMTKGGEMEARSIIIARIKYLEKYRGGDISKNERKDCELFYLKKSYMEFKEREGRVESLEDPKLVEFMMREHPRWYELVSVYGSPIEELNNNRQKDKNIKSNSI